LGEEKLRNAHQMEGQRGEVTFHHKKAREWKGNFIRTRKSSHHVGLRRKKSGWWAEAIVKLKSLLCPAIIDVTVGTVKRKKQRGKGPTGRRIEIPDHKIRESVFLGVGVGDSGRSRPMGSREK